MPVTGGFYCLLFEKKTVKRSVQCHVFAQLPKDHCKRLSKVTYSPSNQKKTVTGCPMSRIRPVSKQDCKTLSNVTYSPSYQKKTVKHSVQCQVFAQNQNKTSNALSKVTYSPSNQKKTVNGCPMSRIRQFIKRRL